MFKYTRWFHRNKISNVRQEILLILSQAGKPDPLKNPHHAPLPRRTILVVCISRNITTWQVFHVILYSPYEVYLARGKRLLEDIDSRNCQFETNMKD